MACVHTTGHSIKYEQLPLATSLGSVEYTAPEVLFTLPSPNPEETLPNYFKKISVIMTLSLGSPPLPPLLLASWQK